MRTSAVVTGGARGIGRAIAELLVREGHAVVVTDVDEEAVRRTASEIGAVAGLGQDVRDEAGHGAAVQEAQRHAPLAVWVNNAGVGDDGTLVGLTSEQVRRLVEVNLLGAMWGMRAALAGFGPEGGSILNIASLSGLGPVPGLSTYAATKAALVSLSMSVHLETPKNVHVHALCPDGVRTDLLEQMDPKGSAKQLTYSGGRVLTPEEVAAEAVALIGGRRVVRTLPTWRGAAMRATSLMPSVAAGPLSLFKAQGKLKLRRRR